MERKEKKEKKTELEIELEQTIDFLRKRMSEYEFEYNKQLRDIKFLEEENKKLKSDLAFERNMLDNVRAEYESLQNVIKKLKDIQKEVKPTQKSKTITVTDEDNRIILEKGEDGKRHSY